MKDILLLITTVCDKSYAEKIAKLLINKKLAACVSIKKIISFYNWEEKVQKDNEYEIIVKSTPEKLNELIFILRKEIQYEIPQFIYKTFDSEINYYGWVQKSVR